MADFVGISEEEVLVYLAADKAKNYRAQQAWTNIAKKYNGLCFTAISIICGAIVAPLEPIRDYVLYLLMLNAIAYASPIKCLSFEGLFNEVSRND
ncbi:DUF3693 domain-containing protein [Vibrio parahaemolyticus]